MQARVPQVSICRGHLVRIVEAEEDAIYVFSGISVCTGFPGTVAGVEMACKPEGPKSFSIAGIMGGQLKLKWGQVRDSGTLSICQDI